MADTNPLESLFGESDEPLIEMTTKHKKMYDSYIDAGFSEEQAITLVAAFVSAATSTIFMLNHEPGEQM